MPTYWPNCHDERCKGICNADAPYRQRSDALDKGQSSWEPHPKSGLRKAAPILQIDPEARASIMLLSLSCRGTANLYTISRVALSSVKGSSCRHITAGTN